MDDIFEEPRDLCRRKLIDALGYDDNANARPEASGSGTHRPSSAPASPCLHSVCRQGSCQFSPIVETSSRNLSGAQAAGKLSSGSLVASMSFETPLGVVHQSSSSIVEPVRMHSGTSQESFRRELSVYKLNAMPMLAENADSSDEDDECGHGKKSSVLSKFKKSKRCGKCKHTNKRCCEDKDSKSGDKSKTGCSGFFKLLFTCTKSPDKEYIDTGTLLDVTKDGKDAVD